MNEIPLAEERATPWEAVSQNDVRLVALLLVVRLETKYGREMLVKVDEENKGLPLENDAIYNHIEPAELFNEFIDVCEVVRFNWRNPHYTECFSFLRKDGYHR